MGGIQSLYDFESAGFCVLALKASEQKVLAQALTKSYIPTYDQIGEKIRPELWWYIS